MATSLTPMSKSALVLLSGGLDSTTLLASMLDKDPGRRIEALFINYGQRHIREAEASEAIAAHYGVPWYVLDLRGFGKLVSSALTSDDIAVPHGHYAADNMAITVVPGRNATFLSAAAGVAESRDLDSLAVAMHAGDHTIYPDCRPEFVKAISVALWSGYQVEVVAPLLYATKTDIAADAAKLGVPIAMSWSCYEGGEIHCGRCGTCVERLEAFVNAGVPDPTEYADREFWKQQTANTATDIRVM